MLSTDDLRQIKADCENAGHKIIVKDISFIIVKRMYSDVIVAYKSIYNDNKSDKEIHDFVNSPAIKFLSMYVDSLLKQRQGIDDKPTKNKKKTSKEDDITFEENKAELIKLIKETQDALERGEIETKDALKIQAELRVKLNDKFNVQEEIKDNVVQVFAKFNSICSCGREIYIPTKEDLMKKYNLIENNN